jgi:perosamine synthetase
MVNRIPVAGPSITDLEIEYVSAAAASSWYSEAGAPTTAFEHEFAAYVGRRHAVALPSCTAGIHLVLKALGIGPGDEVVVPDITWIATSAPISYVGATPVFADVDPDLLCVTPESVSACLTERTRAVIPVDLYGAIPDMDPLMELTSEHSIHVVEDAAEAIGSEVRGRRAGAFGVASVFSFHGSKTLTTGEGGMIVTDDEDLKDRVDVLRDHGRQPGDRAFENSEVAFKYKMSSLQAALGRAQLRRIDELLSRKREIWSWYASRLEGIDGVRLLRSDVPGIVWWMSTILIDEGLGFDKDDLQQRLDARGIDTRPVFRPLSSLPAYAAEPQAAAARARNSNAYRVSPRGLNLPSALSLTETDVDRVCRELRAALK